MVIDSTTPFDVQDLMIANSIVQEGRGLVFALNKWDTISEDKKHKFMNNSITMIEQKVPLVKGCPIVPISALYSKNIDKLVDACLLVYKEWNEYIEQYKKDKNYFKFCEEHEKIKNTELTLKEKAKALFEDI